MVGLEVRFSPAEGREDRVVLVCLGRVCLGREVREDPVYQAEGRAVVLVRAEVQEVPVCLVEVQVVLEDRVEWEVPLYLAEVQDQAGVQAEVLGRAVALVEVQAVADLGSTLQWFVLPRTTS